MIRTATAAVLCMLSGSALAETVDVEFLGRGSRGSNVTVSLHNGLSFADGSTSRRLWVGQLRHSIDGETYDTFCTELTQWAGDGQFEVTNVKDAPSSIDGMGEVKAQAIRNLFSSSTLDFSSNSAAAAFQAVIWEIVYDYDGSSESISSTDLEVGNVRFDSIHSRLFNEFAQAAFGGAAENLGTQVRAIVNPNYQDQLVAVPVPTAALLSTPVLGLVAARRRRA